MALRSELLAVFLAILLSVAGTARSMSLPDAVTPPPPKAISDLRDAIVKALGFQSEELKISGFDIQDALVGHSVAYEFDIEVGKKKFPIKLLEDVNRWEYVDLPIFRVEEAVAVENGLVKTDKSGGQVLPVLAPFQLAGPMELWIQDGEDMRVSLPCRAKQHIWKLKIEVCSVAYMYSDWDLKVATTGCHHKVDCLFWVICFGIICLVLPVLLTLKLSSGYSDTSRGLSHSVFVSTSLLISLFVPTRTLIGLDALIAGGPLLAEILWLQYLLHHLHIPVPRPPLLLCDNMSAVHMARNPVFHGRTKHIDIDVHFVRDHVLKNSIQLRHIPGVHLESLFSTIHLSSVQAQPAFYYS